MVLPKCETRELERFADDIASSVARLRATWLAKADPWDLLRASFEVDYYTVRGTLD